MTKNGKKQGGIILKKYNKIIGLLLAVAIMLPGMATKVSAAEMDVERLEGIGRVETSIAVSNEVYTKSDTVVLAGYSGEVDALTGTLLAGLKDAPLLLTRQTLEDKIKDELVRLGAKNVYLLGGPTAISVAVENELKALNYTVKRVEGLTREETAVAIAKEAKVANVATTNVFLAKGWDVLADALAAGPVSAMNKMPVLLTKTNSIPKATVDAMKELGVTNVTLLGKEAAISATVEAQLTALGYTVTRVGGDDREKTAVAIAAKYFTSPKEAVVASGYVYADALVGGYLGAKKMAPILLTNAASAKSSTIDYLKANTDKAFILGGPSAVSAAVEKQVSDAIVGNELVVESVSAINAKTLKVTFNKAADVKAADFTVNKGTVKTNIASVALSEDKTVATIELTSKMTKGEYTVTVAQEDADALVASVTVEAEKVAKIEIASEVAPITKAATVEAEGKAVVGAKVLNQYGEDITKFNSGDVVETVAGAGNDGTLDSKGVLTLTLNKNAKVGESVYITLVHKGTGVSTQATVKLSDEAAIKEITFGELYNKDGKTLTQDTDETKDKFYLPIEAKDQYGKEVSLETLKKSTELVLTNTNPAVAEIDEIVNNITSMKINDKDVNVIKIGKTNLAGTTNLIAVALKTGANATATVKVEAGVKIASLNLAAPQEIVTAGKDVLFPLTIVDTAGKEIKTKKDFDALNAKDKVTITGAEQTIVEVKDKGIFVKVAGMKEVNNVSVENVVKDSPVTVVVTSSTGKSSTQTVIPRAKAVATVITGLDSKVSTAIRANDSTGIVVKNTELIVEDQYGQVIDKKDLGTFKFTAIPENGKAFKITNGTTAATTQTIENVATPNLETSGKITFKIDGDTTGASALTKTFTVVKDSEFESYKIEDIDTIYVVKGSNEETYTIPAYYGKDIVVKALAGSGKEVTLDVEKDYTVKSTVLTGVNTDSKIDGSDAAKIEFAKDTKTTTAKITITINATGEELVKEVTFSNVASKVESIKLVADGATTGVVTQEKLAALKEVKVEEAKATFNKDSLLGKVDVVQTDQYGVMKANEVSDNLAMTITFTKVSGDVTFAKNGTADAAVTAAEAGAVFNARINVNGVSATLKVTATEKITTP